MVELKVDSIGLDSAELLAVGITLELKERFDPMVVQTTLVDRFNETPQAAEDTLIRVLAATYKGEPLYLPLSDGTSYVRLDAAQSYYKAAQNTEFEVLGEYLPVGYLGGENRDFNL